MKDLFRYNIIKPANGIWEVQGLPKGEYDKQAVQYDKLVSNALYNRFMWGNSPVDYTRFLKQNLKDADKGIVADIGCGTLSFTSKVYKHYNKHPLFLCDFSVEMLKIGKKRLEAQRKTLQPLQFLRADALNMPFHDHTVQTVLCFGILHIFEKPAILINEIRRFLTPKGELHLTSLCTDRKFSAKYLKFLFKKGHVAKPMSSAEIAGLIENCGFKIIRSVVKGGMFYVSAMSN